MFLRNYKLHSKVYFILKHFCYLKLAMHFMRSKKLTNKKQKISSEKQKGFRDGPSYSTPQKRDECLHYGKMAAVSVMRCVQEVTPT